MEYVSVPLKQCKMCKEYKVALPSFWHRNKARGDGLENYCKSCAKEYHKNRRFWITANFCYPLSEKKCSKCDQIFPATSEFFFKSNRNNSGLSSQCKTCLAAYTKQYSRNYDYAAISKMQARKNRTNNKGRDPYSVGGTKLCSDCHQELPVTEFYRNITRPDGLKSVCKVCSKKRKRDYEKRNPQKAKMSARHSAIKWRRNNPYTTHTNNAIRYSRRRGLPDNFTEADWQYALDYFNGCCAVCGRQLNDMFGEFKAAADHWIPVSYEGDDNPGTVPTNIVPLCHGLDGCNNRKSAKLPEQWLTETYGRKQAQQILVRIQSYFEQLNKDSA